MNEKIRQVFWLIWLATIRVIWNVRNNSVFNNMVKKKKKKYKINPFRLSALIPYIQLRDTHFDGKLFYFILFLQEEFFYLRGFDKKSCFS